MGKNLTLTEQLMANRAAKVQRRRSHPQETPGEVLAETLREMYGESALEVVYGGGGEHYVRAAIDLDDVARNFLHKVMASG